MAVVTQAAAEVQLYLLGPPYLTVGGRRRAVPNKGLVLLALVLLGGPQTRDDLIRLLWPDLTPTKARNNLRVLLSTLRGLSPDLLEVDRLGVRSARLWSDVLVLEGAALAGQAGETPDLWRGPLLDGVPLPSGTEVAEWVRAQRARWYAHSPASGDGPLTWAAPEAELLGRETDQAALLRLLGPLGLVTLHGLDGVGKTALGRALARQLGEEATFADLAGAHSGEGVALALARALQLAPGDGLREVLSVLRRRPGVLILDGADRLAPGGPLDDLRTSLPQHRLLLLRRRPLGLAAERPYLLTPLAHRPTDLQGGPPELLASPAAALFAARARALCPELILDAPVVAEIGALLGGLPQALEWAAAYCRVLPLSEVLGQLQTPGGTLSLLRAGPQTLESLLRPSLDELSPGALGLLRQLARLDVVLTLEEMGEVLDTEPRMLLPLLEELLAASVLRRTALGSVTGSGSDSGAGEGETGGVGGGRSVFGVPRLVRLITVPEVSSPGEAMPDDTAPNEAAPLLPWLLTTAQRDHGRCGAPVSEVTLERWQRLDAALRRELEVALGAPALRPVALALCETLVWWWTLRGEAAVGLDWLERLGSADAFALGVLGVQLGQPQAPALLEGVWDDDRALPQRRGLAAALLAVASGQGAAISRRWLGRARAYWAEQPGTWGVALTLRLDALRSPAARGQAETLRRAYDTFAGLDDPLGMTLCALETTALRGERRDENSLRRRVAEARALGQPWLLAQELGGLCTWLLAQGRATEALPLVGEQLRAWGVTGWRWGELLAVLHLVRVAELLGHRLTASRLAGLAWRLLRAGGSLLGSPLAVAAERQLGDLPGRLRSAAERRAWREAVQFPHSQAAAEAYRLSLTLRGANPQEGPQGVATGPWPTQDRRVQVS